MGNTRSGEEGASAQDPVVDKIKLLHAQLGNKDRLESMDKEDLLDTIQGLRQSLNYVLGDRQVTPEEILLAEEVIDFMILPDTDACLQRWFGKSQDTDQLIWQQFGENVALASKGYYDHWALETKRPRLLVALVIMMDQFRRNMFRDTKDMYTSDKHCRVLVLRALDANIELDHLSTAERIFLCLVLTHAEDVDAQYRCMAEWAKVAAQIDPESDETQLLLFEDIFQRHVDVVAKFGRFPHRNVIYGRPDTPEEAEFLSDSSFRFDLPVTKGEDGTIKFQRPGKVLWSKARNKIRDVMKAKKLENMLNPPPGSSVKMADIITMVDISQLESLNFGYDGLTPSQLSGGGRAGDSADASNQQQRSYEYSEKADANQVTFMQLSDQRVLRIGETAPNFSAQTTEGFINLYDYLGDGWGLIFSHPADFTPVCTTELGRVAQLSEEWAKRDVKVLGLSVDGIKEHRQWIQEINMVMKCDVRFPLIDDSTRRISMKFGMLDQSHFRSGNKARQTLTVRSVFIIDPDKKISLILSYPAQVGRNFDEVVRCVDALQLNRQHKVATPVDWVPGDDVVILPFITDEEATQKYPEGFKKETTYLRFIKDPSLKPQMSA